MFRLSRTNYKYDAIIVGARCAGAATAMLLARAGARVLMVDRGARGSDMMSTHALMRPAIIQLYRWGLLPAVAASGAAPVRRTTFHYGDEVIPIDMKPRDGIDALYAPRRRVIDGILVTAAIEAGAEVQFGTSFEAVKRDAGGRVTGAHLSDRSGRSLTLKCDVLIGADGVRSSVADQVDAPVLVRSDHRTAVVYGYFAGLENKGYQWHYRPGTFSGAIPTNDGLHCVFASVPPASYRRQFGEGPFNGLIRVIGRTDPELARRLYEVGPQDGLHRFPGVSGHIRQSNGPGWALVGDAGYFKDPITAHGISDAFLDAERLATALQRDGGNALPSYQAARDHFAQRLFGITDTLASFDWDLEEAKSLHLALNNCLKAELAAPPAVDLPAQHAA